MKKTLKLLEHYISLLEQDADEVEEVEQEVVEVEQEPPSPGLQALGELIAAAFVYPPTDENANRIREVELALLGTHNHAPPIKNIKPRFVINSVVDELPDELRKLYMTVDRGDEPSKDISAEDEIYLAQVLADAYRYKPTNQEGLVASTVSKEYADKDTWEVIDTIQRLIQFSDEPNKDELEDIQ